MCGRIVAYQVGAAQAFQGFHFSQQDLDGYYVDGISITHGQSPRQHIWTFVTALGEGFHLTSVCPCHGNGATLDRFVPSFIGEDFFCDTGERGGQVTANNFYANDPLWDGQGCGGNSTCCDYNNPPWFCKQLPQPTTDDVELRLCDAKLPEDDSPFEIVEIYVS